ncbi:hypothetical protein [Nostoc sp. UHCC 0870]
MDSHHLGKFFMLFLPTPEIQQLRKIRRRSVVSGAGCDYLDYLATSL